MQASSCHSGQAEREPESSVGYSDLRVEQTAVWMPALAGMMTVWGSCSEEIDLVLHRHFTLPKTPLGKTYSGWCPVKLERKSGGFCLNQCLSPIR